MNRGLHAEFPDFEAVHHLVIDAVDSYNEAWERAFKDQEQLKVRACVRTCSVCVCVCAMWVVLFVALSENSITSHSL